MADIKSKLVLDNTQFNRKAKASKAVIGGLAGGLKLMGSAAKFAAVGLTTAAVGLTAIIARTSATIDRLGKVAKTTGFATETLQKFGFAAEQSGVSTEQAQVALRRFSRRLGEAQKGTGELLPALKKLGINTRDASGNLKSGEQILFEFADGLANTENASERLALAFKAFDSEGAELVEVLKNGSDGLREFFSEAERLGFILSADAVQGVEKFRDELNKLQRVIGGVARQFVAALAPALEDLTTDLTNAILKFIETKGGAEEFGNFLKNTFIGIIIQLIEAFELLANILIKIANGFALITRRLGDDPLFGLGDKASQAAKDIITLRKVMDNFDPGFFGVINQDEFNDFVKTLDRSDPIIKKALDKFYENFDPKKYGTEATFDNIILEMIEGLEATIGAGMAPVDFSQFIEKLMGYTEGDGKPTGEKIGIDIADGMLSVGTQKSSFLVKLLDKIYGSEGQARVDEFLQGFFDDAEDMFEKLQAFAKLIFGPELVASIKAAFEASDVGDFIKTLAEGLVKGAQMFEDALADAVINGKADFSDLADHLKRVLAKAMVQKFITGPIMKAFGFPIPGLASGGPAKAGQPYIVGEEGPELFMPSQSGTVIPNNQLQGSGGMAATSVVYNIQAVDAPSFQSLVARDPEFIYNVSRAGARRTPGG